MSSVKTAVFPVAGLGTRFLPATKSVAKEMLSIVDKPLIQYGAEEAIEAGINKLVFIVGRTKNSIIDHFDKSYELETELAIRGKDSLLKIVKDVIPDGVHCVFIRQSEALGLGHAVLCAEPAVLRGRRFGNIVVVAQGVAAEPLDHTTLVRRCACDPSPARVVHGAALDAFVGGRTPASDDEAQWSPAPPPGLSSQDG